MLTSPSLFQELFSRIAQALQQKSSSLQDLSSVQEPSSNSTIDVKKIEAGVCVWGGGGSACNKVEIS